MHAREEPYMPQKESIGNGTIVQSVDLRQRCFKEGLGVHSSITLLRKRRRTVLEIYFRLMHRFQATRMRRTVRMMRKVVSQMQSASEIGSSWSKTTLITQLLYEDISRKDQKQEKGPGGISQ